MRGGRGQRILLDREAELEALGGAIDRAREGAGSVILVEGPPGIGKTALLEVARERAEDAGFGCLGARGSELEHAFAFGVVRQLFERRLVELGDQDREQALAGAAALAGVLFETGPEAPPTSAGGGHFPLLHGLHWLCANLAAEQPLLLSVDDAHWADQPSLRFLHYLAGRVEELPVLVVAGARTTAPQAPVELVEAMRSEPAVGSIPLGPLSENAASELLEAVLGEAPEPAFTAAAWRATGGNPFLLIELAGALAADSVAPHDEAAERIDAIGPEPVARSVLTRLARMPEEAQELARSVAVLGDGAELAPTAALSGLSDGRLEEEADRLARAGVLEESPPLRFTHPLVRAAVHNDLPGHDRARRHALAAEALDAHGAPAEASCGHLLLAEPAGQQGRVALLRRAGAEALGRGAPQAAVDFLLRALVEDPAGADRLRLLSDLGAAEIQGGIPEGVEHLREALALSDDAQERADLTRTLALGLAQAARFTEAIEVLRAELDASSEAPDEVGLELECDLAGTLLFGLDSDFPALDAMLERVVPGRPARTRAERGLLVAWAYRRVQQGLDANSAARAAEQALEEGLLDEFPPGSPMFLGALHALVCADALDEARRWAAQGLSGARAAAIPIGIAQSANILSLVAFRQGRIADAEAAADEALGVVREHGIVIGLPACLSALIDPMIERGGADAAWGELEGIGLTGELPDFFTTALLTESRGRLRAARGDLDGGRDDLLDAGRRYERWGVRGPGISAWRSAAAEVQLRLGGTDEARRLAAEELELARAFGAARPIGCALRALGLVEGTERGLDLLGEAVRTLAASEDRLEHARALVDLGAALRRANRRRDAREPLRTGLDAATRFGATALAERAREELVATGARPRKLVLSGVESLTPAELRTARMAAEGLSNREIAQALFVTQKTVETHLRHAYQKLDVAGREELSGALGAA